MISEIRTTEQIIQQVIDETRADTLATAAKLCDKVHSVSGSPADCAKAIRDLAALCARSQS